MHIGHVGGTAPYERHLDGLRAFAVLAVLFFHCGFLLVPKGFLGVDVFFVISGYLISTILKREFDRTQRIDFVNFYVRRGRRLLPNFFLVLAFTALLAPLFLKSEEVRDLGKSVVAAAAYLSNVHFFRQIGYFAPAAEDFPLLHTWSLAAEEQFYLVWPMLLLLALRSGSTARRNHAAIANVAVGMLSLVACALAQFGYPDHAFYLTPFRVWEFSAGAFLALSPPTRLFAAAAQSRLLVTATIYLAAFVLIGVVCNPGWFAAFPMAENVLAVICTALLICFVPMVPANGISRLLVSNGAGYVGRISYSLYLWHWPVIVFYRTMNPGVFGFDDRIVALLLSVALGCLAYHWIENPIRTGQRITQLAIPSKAAVMAVASSALFIGAGLLLWRSGLSAYSDSVLELTARASGDVNPKRRDCLASYAQTEVPTRSLCTSNALDENAPIVVVWGDSHADALSPGLIATLPQDFKVLQRTKTGCAPLLGIDIELRGRKYLECSEFNRRVHEEIAAFPPGRVALVVMAARWNYYFLGERDSTAAPDAAQAETLRAALQETLGKSTLRETPILLIGTVPEFEWDVPACVSRSLHFGRGAEACNQNRYAVSMRSSFTNQVLLSATGGLPNRVFVDPMSVLCERQVCLGSIDERTVLYSDKDHLTTEGARRLARWMLLQPGVATLGLSRG